MMRLTKAVVPIIKIKMGTWAVAASKHNNRARLFQRYSHSIGSSYNGTRELPSRVVIRFNKTLKQK